MDDLLTRFWTDLTERWSGPFAFRFIMQPVMAAFYAFRDGRKDAGSAQVPYFQRFVTAPHHRPALMREAWQAVGRIVALGVVMDTLYQIIVFRWIYPLELLVMVVVLAVLPYIALRGLFTRALRQGTRLLR